MQVRSPTQNQIVDVLAEHSEDTVAAGSRGAQGPVQLSPCRQGRGWSPWTWVCGTHFTQSAFVV